MTTAEPRDHRTLSVLVVDDDEFSRMLVRSILGAHGITKVHLATDGKEAIRTLCIEEIDLVTSDIMMEGLNGLKMLSTIRGQASGLTVTGKDIPVILISAHAETKVVEAARRMGADAFLAKPVNPERLIAAVSRLCKVQIAFRGRPKRVTDEGPAEKPAADTPAADTPAADTPAADTPADVKPAEDPRGE